MIYFYYYVHTLSFLSRIFQQVKYTIFPPSLFGNIIILMHTSKRDSQKANTPGVLFIDDIIFTVSPSSIHCYSQLSKKYIHCSVMKVVVLYEVLLYFVHFIQLLGTFSWCLHAIHTKYDKNKLLQSSSFGDHPSCFLFTRK